MEDDMKRWSRIKTSLFQKTENDTDPQTAIKQNSHGNICYIITESKNHSWMEDLYRYEKKNCIDKTCN